MGNDSPVSRQNSNRTDRSQSAPPASPPPQGTLQFEPSDSPVTSKRSTRSNTMTPTYKPYHEKQSWEMCLMHALNALFQCKKFTNDDMDNICNLLAPDKMINPHKSILQTGNYDANVLMMALKLEDVDVQWFDSRKAETHLKLNDEFLCPKDKYSEFLGFIVNNPHKRMIVFNRRHWLTIKRIDGVWYDLDSKNSAPKRYEEKQLLDWLVAACLNDAQIMICRTLKKETLKKTPSKKAPTKKMASKKTTKKQEYTGPLKMANSLSATDVKSKK